MLEEIRIAALFPLLAIAVLQDLDKGKISNGLIFTGLLWGLSWQITSQGLAGALIFSGGMLLPFLLLSPAFLLHRLGAGDIKLLGVIGGFFGPTVGIRCIAAAFAAALLPAICILMWEKNMRSRISFALPIFAGTAYEICMLRL